MDFFEIYWDLDDDPDGNVEHLAGHGISKEEFEEVFANPEAEATSHSSGRPMAFGWTSTGRYLAIVWEEAGEGPPGHPAIDRLRDRPAGPSPREMTRIDRPMPIEGKRYRPNGRGELR